MQDSDSQDEVGEVIYSFGSRTVTRYGKDKIIKSGVINTNEVDALRFVASNTSIPVPRVHEIRGTGSNLSIVMDHMPGYPLDGIWESFSHEQKVQVVSQFGSYISQLHGLKGSYIGGMNHGAATIGRFGRVYCGPFDDEEQFNLFLFQGIKKTPVTIRHYATPCLKGNHEIIFCHGDLSPRNVLVDKNGQITAILDWEDAGWYPEYWDHYRAMRDLRPMPDWPEYFHFMLPYAYEQEVMGMIYLSMISRF